MTMTTRVAARARKRAPAIKKRAPAIKKRHGGRRPLPASRTYTAELIAHIRHRYEDTPEPVVHMAADLDMHPQSVHRLAKNRGWIRRRLEPRGMPPALRLLQEAQALGAAGVGAADAAGVKGATAEVKGEAVPRVTLPPQGGGEAEAVPALHRQTRLPSQEEGGEPTAVPSSPEDGQPSMLTTVERLHRAVLAELATVETMRAALGAVPQKPIEAERTVRTLGLLTQTLQHVQRLRAALAPPTEQASATGQPTETDDDILDDITDIDEFRRDLARRIDAFVASRTVGSGDRGGEAAEGLHQARS